MIVSAGITEHIEGLSQLIRWQDVITSTLKNSQRTVKKSQKRDNKGGSNMYADVAVSARITEHIKKGPLPAHPVARCLQISVRPDLPNWGPSGLDQIGPDQTGQTGPDWTRPDQTSNIRLVLDQTWTRTLLFLQDSWSTLRAFPSWSGGKTSSHRPQV